MSQDIIRDPTPAVPPRRPLRLAVYIFAILLGALLVVGMAWYVWRRGVAPAPPPGISLEQGPRHGAWPGMTFPT